MTLELLEKEMIGLPAEQRVTLANRILASVEPEAAPEVDSAWDEEIRARIQRYDRGETVGIPADEVFAEADARLQR